MTGSCPEHGPAIEPEHRFCEVCGRGLVDLTPSPTVWLSSRAAGGACAACGGMLERALVYCDHCGRRQSIGRAHAELDLGMVAAVTDRGHRRRRNEDAVAIGCFDGGCAAVVCDGVSTSTRADAASHAAAEAGLAALLAALALDADATDATLQGARAAAVAARDAAGPDASGDAPPSCTYVSGIATADAVTVGWIGDSRAYWLGVSPSCLTVDDSVAGWHAAGRTVPSDDPSSRALVRWLGADSGDPEAQVATLRPHCSGLVLLCTDGLHHYLPDPPSFTGAPIDVARRLVGVALDGGGHDNIAVAVLSGGSAP